MTDIANTTRTASQGLRLRQRAYLFAVSVMALAGTLGGCANERMMPIVYMPTPPKECEQVMGFKVEPLPAGKSNAAKLSVDMAKEGAARQQEHTISKVCAEYALRTAGVMKDKEAPKTGEPAVAAASTVPKPRADRSARAPKTEEVAQYPGSGS